MPAIADVIGEFAARTTLRDVPDEVLGRARHLALDSVGVAFAAVDQEFTQRARKAAAALGPGDQPVLGLPDRLAPREAALLNAVLVHGLDFDDTHLPAITHVSATALPVSLAAAIQHGRSAEDLLLAYVLGIEISARVGTVAHGGFHATGFHPTGLAGAFGSSVAAAKLAGLPADGIAESQRIVGSMASGILEFLSDGAWTKRLHPGWAATSALTAATFASVGWPGPEEVYEGRYGLYATHLRDTEWDATEALDGLGERWELLATAVKPYPSCHFTHAFADAILVLKESEGFAASDVETVRCLIHETPAAAVCEPIERKRRPQDDYDAKFSLPFIAGACLARDRLTLDEFTPESLADPEILRLAQLVEIADDPDSRFPQAYSAEVEIVLTDGRRLHRREDVNRGHTDRPLSEADIRAKFTGNLGERAQPTMEHVLALGTAGSAAEFAEALRAA
ncbi:MmgE/PrpD family protein [Saccharopolyspora gloriosae]|uniref:2-methylcitrate dehydratase PrpD n=1 Tax=Saccharopolyspora gloriosae TaxID=455344 RepID=A0A840NJV2_9PSEU|nr:MmgE/PrpD family protein [Saccharopolyspora gloriosae]MBB5070315.1 2-methylcitrate dehydratase PrpD [Saccharopolyspora gloriosae]